MCILSVVWWKIFNIVFEIKTMKSDVNVIGKLLNRKQVNIRKKIEILKIAASQGESKIKMPSKLKCSHQHVSFFEV